jgi:type VI secretion system protein ImpF
MKKHGVTASLLDRLLGNTGGSPGLMPGQVSLDDYIASVARDVEQLLNDRNALKRIDPARLDNDTDEGVDDEEEPVPPSLVDQSVLMYGLPDTSALSLANSRHRQALVAIVRTAIETFEPRLHDVRVQLADQRRSTTALEFTIRATLRVEDAAATVGFEAWYESTSLHFAVSLPRGRAHG